MSLCNSDSDRIVGEGIYYFNTANAAVEVIVEIPGRGFFCVPLLLIQLK